MKRLVIIIALIIVLKPLLPVAAYALNYDYIVSELCDNRDNRAMHCNGKCQLKKELAKASDNTESNTHERKMKLTEYEVLFITAPEEFFFSKASYFRNVTDCYNNFYAYKQSSNIFHPPLL